MGIISFGLLTQIGGQILFKSSVFVEFEPINEGW